MHTYKIICLLFTCLVFIGCGGSDDYSSQKQVEYLNQELAEKNAIIQDLQSNYISQNADIGKILEELATVSGNTAKFRIDVENGTAQMTRADQISANIDAIKQRIAALESAYSSLEGKSQEMKQTISGLKKVINEQEKQINYLKNEIASKDIQIMQQSETISDQRQEISEQLQTITEQKVRLERMVYEQAKALYDAGVEFESFGDNPPEVTKNKNKEKIIEMQEDIYTIALEYFQKAYDAGYTQASYKISSVSSKIANLSKSKK